MKLNKVLALALSGVMAVSMLAGCSTDGKKDDSSSEPVVPTTAVGKVIAALDSDTTDKVTFTADSDLQTALDKVIKNAGWDTSKVTTTAMLKVDDFGKDGSTVNLSKINSSEATDKKEETVLKVMQVSTFGVSESYAIDQLAKLIDGEDVYDTSDVCANLPKYTRDYGDHYYTLKYTGNVAVSAMENAVTGETVYFVAFTVTRTPTEVKK